MHIEMTRREFFERHYDEPMAIEVSAYKVGGVNEQFDVVRLIDKPHICHSYREGYASTYSMYFDTSINDIGTFQQC